MKKTGFLLWLTVSTVHAQISIEKLLSTPFPSSLVTSPQGNHLAWTLNWQGKRNLWLASAPDYQPRQLTKYQQDDGQAISQITFSPDGNTVFFVRGGGANRIGEFPNAAYLPGGTEQTVFQIAVTGGEPVPVGAGHSPVISPKGDRIVFLKDGQLFSALTGEKPQISQLLHTRGGIRTPRFSPDGSQVAFTSDRGDHSFIGLYDFDKQILTYLSPSTDKDHEPVWSPDGKQIAFVREQEPAENFMFLKPMREAPPWSIEIVEMASGKTRTLWQADPGAGSVFWMNDANTPAALLWATQDKIIFPWEKDGWLHYYAIPANGGKPELLTPGSFEVEDAILSADRKSLIFNSNQDDPLHRRIWEVAVSGGKAKPLTPPRTIAWNPAMTADGKLFFLHADSRRPARVAILQEKNEVKELMPESLPADFPALQLVEPESITFTATDGMLITGQLFLPRDSLKSAKRHPAVIFTHGGSRRQMLLGFHYMDYYHKAYAFNQWLASRGFVVLSVNYRSGTGEGTEFREALQYGAGGCSEFNDVLGAGLYLKNRPDVHPEKIGLWGGSYGGYLTAMGLAKASDLFACGVDLHGVHNWNNDLKVFMPDYDPLARPKEADLAFRSSPMAYLDGWRSPVLLIHGDDDHDVLFSETVMLRKALLKQKVEVEQLILPDEGHGFLLHRNWLKVYNTMMEYLERKLK
jgi:dipeptidyl aminopeptidase/acylaminoacyl peptidase